jgi:hypothetical protein
MKAIRDVEIWLHLFLISILDGSERSAVRPAPLILIELEAGWTLVAVWTILGEEKRSCTVHSSVACDQLPAEPFRLLAYPFVW